MGQTVLLILGLAAVLALIVIVCHSYGFSDMAMVVGFLGLFAVYMGVLKHLGRRALAAHQFVAEAAPETVESGSGV